MARRKTAAIPTNGDALETDEEVYAAIDATDQAVADWKEERDHAVDPSEYSDEENEEAERLFREQLEEDDGINRDETGRVIEPDGGDYRPRTGAEAKARRLARKQPAGTIAKSPGRAPRKEKPKQCACQCGAITAGGDFLPGHDAKRKGQLLTAARAGNTEAAEELIRRRWATVESIHERKAKGGTTRDPKARADALYAKYEEAMTTARAALADAQAAASEATEDNEVDAEEMRNVAALWRDAAKAWAKAEAANEQQNTAAHAVEAVAA